MSSRERQVVIPDASRRNLHESENSGRPATKRGPFYGTEKISCQSARYLSHLFQCPEYPSDKKGPLLALSHFIAHALHCTGARLPSCVTYAALILLRRLKARCPTARASSGQKLFISALMVSSKMFCDNVYTNRSWVIVAQRLVHLRDLNQMERDICRFLRWELSVDRSMLETFEDWLNKHFSQDRDLYPTLPLALVSRLAKDFVGTAVDVPLPSIISGVALIGSSDRALGPRLPPALEPQLAPLNEDVHAEREPPTSPGYPSTASGGHPLQPCSHPPFTLIETATLTHPLEGRTFAFALPTNF